MTKSASSELVTLKGGLVGHVSTIERLIAGSIYNRGQVDGA